MDHIPTLVPANGTGIRGNRERTGHQEQAQDKYKRIPTVHHDHFLYISRLRECYKKLPDKSRFARAMKKRKLLV
jgi:myosin-crossreactive antigen